MSSGESLQVLEQGGTVVTATNRLARELRRARDRACLAAGRRVWPSGDVLPLDAWLRRTWEHARLNGSPAGEAALLGEHAARLVWQQQISASTGMSGGVPALARIAQQSWRTSRTWQLELPRLAAAAATVDQQLFVSWARDYSASLAGHSCTDAASLADSLACDFAAGQLRPPEMMLAFAGFDPLPPQLQNLAAVMCQAGAQVRHLAVSDASPCGQVVGCHDADEELRLAAGWARAQAEAAPGRRVAIVMVDHEACGEAARRACLDTLAPGWALYPPATMPVAVTATRPLADFPLIHIALLVLQAGIGELHWRDASQLLRAPCIGGFSRERAARAIVELSLREDCSDSIAAAGLVTRSATEAPEFSARLAAMSAPWPATGSSAGEWSTRFGQRLAASGWPGDRVLSSEEHQALSAWQDLLVEFAAAARVQAALTARDALGILVDMAGSWLFEPAGDEAAVQVVSLRESEGLEFDAVWVAGLSADAWPEPARPDALLELGLQRAAGIPEAVPALQLSRARGRLGRLTASAQAAILSWSARRGDAALTVSPLLSAMPATTASALPVYKGPRHREAVRAAVGSLVEDALDPVRILPPGAHARGGASVLSWQAVCPARAFIENRLNATELRRPRRPLDGRDRGTLVHLLLQHLYSAADCQRGLGELDPDRLRTLFDTAADRAINAVLRAPGPVLARLRGLERVRLWQVTQQMQALDRSRTPFTVEAGEQDHRQQLGPLALSVRIDRVEQLANGQLLVIDYKTGQFSSSGWRGPRPADCQLPLYVVATGSAGCAVIHFQPDSLRLDGVGADDLDIQGLKSPEQFFREPGLTWPAVMQRWQASLQQLAEEFASGDFRIDTEHSEGADGQFAMLTRLHECGVFPGDRNE